MGDSTGLPRMDWMEMTELRENFIHGIATGWTRFDRQRRPPVQYFLQRLSGTAEPALHSSYRDLRERRGVILGKTADPNQDQGFTLRVGQASHCAGCI